MAFAVCGVQTTLLHPPSHLGASTDSAQRSLATARLTAMLFCLHIHHDVPTWEI